MNKSAWPRCYLWHGLLLALVGALHGSWAMSPGDVAGTLFASALVACSGSMLLDLDVDQEHDRASTAEHLTGAA